MAGAEEQPARRDPLPLEDNAALTEDDMTRFLVASAGGGEGLVSHNIEPFNDLLDKGFPQILERHFKISQRRVDNRDQTEADRSRESIQIEVDFENVAVGTPEYSTYPLCHRAALMPNQARKEMRTYAAPLSLGMQVRLTAHYADGREVTKSAAVEPFELAKIPIPVGCNRCHTASLTRAARKGLEEDPNDPGGYLIAKGGEWTADGLENIRFNTPHIHRNTIDSEHVRAEIISQPGDVYNNSSQLVVRLHTSGALTIQIRSMKFKETLLPFYVVFRLLGMVSDRDICESIVYDLESASPNVREMLGFLTRAYQHKYPEFQDVQHILDRTALTNRLAVHLAQYVTNPKAYKTNEDAIRYLNGDLLKILDNTVLPHLGVEPAARMVKLRYLGMMIHKMFLVHLGVGAPMDRDSFATKRIHGLAVSMIKTFKTQYNNAVVQPLVQNLALLVRNNPFEDLTESLIADTARRAAGNAQLDRTLEQAITSSTTTVTIHQKTVTSRFSVNALERKNEANVYSALRAVSAQNASSASKQAERADRMRRIQPSGTGYICVAKSADTGETVGLKKELAFTATVTSAGEPLPLMAALLEDPAVRPADRVPPPALMREGLASIFVNGQWVGCTESAPALVARYRGLRRAGRVVDPRATIAWDPVTGDVEFILDVGRLTRPLLIVDNNIEAYDAGCFAAAKARRDGRPEAEAAALRVPFTQNIGLTPDHIAALQAGRMTLADLVDEGIVEWITPEEATNVLIAQSLDELRSASHDVTRQFTHCDVEQAIFGLTAQVSPYGNHTQPARVTYETNQGRQAGGWYSGAFPFRIDKGRFFQHYVERAAVSTIANDYLSPCGMDTTVAYMVDTGYNQEDSAIVSRAFVERGGFAGSYFQVERAELERDEEFRTPDPASTKNMKPDASYEKLVDGVVAEGSRVEKGDVLIGRVARNTSGGRRGSAAPADADAYPFVDRSIVYLNDEPALVDSVHRLMGPNDTQFVVVKLRYHRPLGVGDKMSSRAGNKSITALLESESNLPFDDNGVTPDIIINPHSIPSRMTIGQMIETLLGLACREKGVVADGTPFRKVNVDEVQRELAELGLRYSGRSRLFNGRTGRHYDAAIFMGSTFHQRLQKFVRDDKYAVGGHGPTDALTGQPLDGKAAFGGLRFGEMEGWTATSHGAMNLIDEKLYRHSDGRKRYVCTQCGSPAIFNEANGRHYKCPRCGEAARVVAFDSCQAAQVLQHEIRSANITMKLGVRPPEFS